ncbi:hypothetical protein H4R18_003568 [Coemansia javaensis]|uniref:Meiosis protein 5 homolog n=1 Tax=Coemansia javaensis TaxID=2761396 RepID=A0A9W8LIE3_9FUNG|nr:hypothetical protein H4R18_003568 [Coemansia javaensis]
MRRSRNAHETLMKPFKSPARAAATATTAAAATATTAAAATATTAAAAEPQSPTRTPTRTVRRRSLASPLAAAAAAACGSPPPAKRARLAARDPEIQALVHEKAALQRQVARVREEAALAERCLALRRKGDRQEVDALVARWQAACAQARDDLFDLLRPAMLAQREAAALGFGGGGGGGSSDQPGAEDAEADIDAQYMLRRLGIDPDLF